MQAPSRGGLDGWKDWQLDKWFGSIEGKYKDRNEFYMLAP